MPPRSEFQPERRRSGGFLPLLVAFVLIVGGAVLFMMYGADDASVPDTSSVSGPNPLPPVPAPAPTPPSGNPPRT